MGTAILFEPGATYGLVVVTRDASDLALKDWLHAKGFAHVQSMDQETIARTPDPWWQVHAQDTVPPGFTRWFIFADVPQRALVDNELDERSDHAIVAVEKLTGDAPTPTWKRALPWAVVVATTGVAIWWARRS